MGAAMRSPVTNPKRITILGSTGSIGCSTLDIVERNPEAFLVEALTAYTNVELLAEQARRFQPNFVAVGDPSRKQELEEALAGTKVAVGAGPEAIIEAAERPSDLTMAAIVGAAGLKPTLQAARRGTTVALANKECLVCAGAFFLNEVEAAGSTLLPVDSEHNAIFQVFDFDRPEAVDKIILTASGGPFRTLTGSEMENVTPEQAVKHPTWDMGAKISVDSATLMNKGLEMIEADYLFPVAHDQIDVLVHPQSVIHSMVAYRDGSVLAQLGSPDMRTPIAYTLGWPNRMDAPAPQLNLAEIGQLSFEPPDPVRFPALRLARQALQSGGTAPTILNAANEVAVQSFLSNQIGFLDIARVVEATLNKVQRETVENLEHVHAVDDQARRAADHIIALI
jgi:1-deoxy-D-xylulose-5-phosphate reductoisomerase